MHVSIKLTEMLQSLAFLPVGITQQYHTQLRGILLHNHDDLTIVYKPAASCYRNAFQLGLIQKPLKTLTFTDA